MSETIEGLAEDLRPIFPDFGSTGRPFVRLLFGLLARGEPVTPEALATATGASPATVRASLARWWGVRYSGEGAIVGFWGLDLAATDHRLRLGGRDLFAWCAWDTLFLPGLIGEEAEVASACPASGSDIWLRVAPNGVLAAGPDDIRLALKLPDPEAVREDVRHAFCCDVRFLAGPEAVDRWQSEHPAVRILCPEEGYRLGRQVWRTLLGEEAP